MSLGLLIIVGLPLIAVLAFLISWINSKKYDEEMLKMLFSIKLRDTERNITNIDNYFKLVNSLTTQEINDTKTWLQAKL